MDKRFIAILLVTIAALGAIFWFSRDKSANDDNGSTQASVSNHTVGAGNKGVEIVEYGDFQCPACRGFFPVLQEVKAKYGDDIKFTFRNFPIDSIHPNARAAHRAAEAAAKQDKFWEFHDLLYQQQDSWKNSTAIVGVMESYAQQLELNMDQFKADYPSEEINRTINADISAGQALRVNSTPTFVINGKIIDSETQQSMATLEGFSKVIDEAISTAGHTPPSAPPAPESAPTPSPAQ